jgi:hypothetical protein
MTKPSVLQVHTEKVIKNIYNIIDEVAEKSPQQQLKVTRQ